MSCCSFFLQRKRDTSHRIPPIQGSWHRPNFLHLGPKTAGWGHRPAHSYLQPLLDTGSLADSLENSKSSSGQKSTCASWTSPILSSHQPTILAEQDAREISAKAAGLLVWRNWSSASGAIWVQSQTLGHTSSCSPSSHHFQLEEESS